MSVANQFVALCCVMDSSNEFLLHGLPKVAASQLSDDSTRLKIEKLNVSG